MNPDTETPTPAFARQLLGSFGYAFTGDGPFLIAAGGVCFTIADIVSTYTSWLGIFIQLAVTGYLAAFARDVVRASALGEEKPPGWTDVTDWKSDLAEPALQLLVVIVLCFAPLIFLYFKHPEAVATTRMLVVAAAAWSCLALPIFCLAVAVTGTLESLVDPVNLLRAIGAMLPDYLLISLFCALFIGLDAALIALETSILNIPILPDLIDRLLGIYLLTVLMRCIGLLYRNNHDRLQWY